MQSDINDYLHEIQSTQLNTAKQIEDFRIRFLSRKSVINDLFKTFKDLSENERKILGSAINHLKNEAQLRLDKALDKNELKKRSIHVNQSENQDYTLPVPESLGSRHPISITQNQIVDIFTPLGFSISEGPEVELEWYNFSALNFPPDHPARDMQDTFFITEDKNTLLRTHTSTVQIRTMKKQKPPIRTLSPGRVYRSETISARSHCIFHQVEGLSIGKTESFRELRSILYYFAKQMFGDNTKIRLRPSFFPFTEPSAELDISCPFCESVEKIMKTCSVCKHTGWIEIAGCGMVDVQVLKNCNINSNDFLGYAFGMGIERIAMLKYKIDDIRLFTENNIGFLQQFKGL